LEDCLIAVSALDTPGATILTYTPDGRRVITAGSNSAIRIYNVGEDGEPTTIDEGVEGHYGIAATVYKLTIDPAMTSILI
jgi:WD40 repeat protein